jgi:hypothetical protein
MFTFCFQKHEFKSQFLGKPCSHLKNVYTVAETHTFVTALLMYYVMDKGKGAHVVCHEGVSGNGCTAPLNINLGT